MLREDFVKELVGERRTRGVMGYSSSRANLSNPREGYASLGVRALGLEQQQTLMPLPLGVAVPLMRVSLGRGEERATNKTNPLRFLQRNLVYFPDRKESAQC